MQHTKESLVAAIGKFIRQRSGIDWRNYGSDKFGGAYKGDKWTIARHGKHARIMLAAVASDDAITVEQMIDGLTSCRRLSILQDGSIDYCTGQYFPTEYRAAACRYLAELLWVRHALTFHEMTRKGERASDAVRREFRRMFGRAIGNRWFN